MSGPTGRTTRIWRRLERRFVEERRRGFYDVDARTPSTITAHEPGYIDRDQELIVGLQTSAPLRRVNFVKLTTEQQKDVISRTFHGSLR